MTTLNQAFKTFNHRRATEAALTNEMLTRQRVEKLEAEAKKVERWSSRQDERLLRLETLVARGFFGRLRWLLLGGE